MATIPWTASLDYNAGGDYVEFYTDDDGASGNGDHAKVIRWYGPLVECQFLAKVGPPANCEWQPLEPWSGVDEFDLACERRSD